MSAPNRRPRKQRSGCLSLITNLLTLILLFVAMGLIALVVVFFTSPQSLASTPLAPFLPTIAEPTPRTVPTTAAAAVVPSPTITLTPTLQPTFTPRPTQPRATAAPSNTPRPSATVTETPFIPTRTPVTPSSTPTPTPSETPDGPTPTASATRSAFPFTKSDISPFYLQNFANNAGCNWLGIAGEVLDLNRNPVVAGTYVVRIWGDGLEEQNLVVGSAPAYGPSGWEQFLFDSPTVRNYNVQLVSPNGTPVSQVYALQTRASCTENLIKIDFVQNR